MARALGGTRHPYDGTQRVRCYAPDREKYPDEGILPEQTRVQGDFFGGLSIQLREFSRLSRSGDKGTAQYMGGQIHALPWDKHGKLRYSHWAYPYPVRLRVPTPLDAGSPPRLLGGPTAV